MAPSGEAYNVDWIISNTSNVHVANNRDWFTSFTPFETHYGHIYSTGSRTEVAGIGTVQLNAKLHRQKRSGQTNSRIITLHDVLFAPGSICNIIGQPIFFDDGFQLDLSKKMLIAKDSNRAGVIEMTTLPHLRLHGQRGGRSILDADSHYMINAHWPDTERARWDAHQAGQQSIPVNAYNGDAPYSTDEKGWLKEHFGGEFKFLRSFGLSIYDEDERTEGRAIVRSWMTEDGDEPKGNEHEHEDEDEDDTDKFLQELEDDPVSHLADYNFSDAELKWIQKHYQYSSKFMLSYGLKPFEQEDCDEAKAIVGAMMETA